MLSVLLNLPFAHACRIYVGFCKRQGFSLKAFACYEVQQTYKLAIQAKVGQMGKKGSAYRDSPLGSLLLAVCGLEVLQGTPTVAGLEFIHMTPTGTCICTNPGPSRKT